MLSVSGDRPSSDDQNEQTTRRSSEQDRTTKDRYQRLHTALFVLGAILFTAAIIITIITVIISIF